jgi:hypothetical protein
VARFTPLPGLAMTRPGKTWVPDPLLTIDGLDPQTQSNPLQLAQPRTGTPSHPGRQRAAPPAQRRRAVARGPHRPAMNGLHASTERASNRRALSARPCRKLTADVLAAYGVEMLPTVPASLRPSRSGRLPWGRRGTNSAATYNRRRGRPIGRI